MDPFDLLIIWRDGTHRTVSNVNDFGTVDNINVFFFKKNGFTNFVVRDDVSYFGRSFDWNS